MLPRAAWLLVEALDAFRTRYDDLRHANDDTPLLRWIRSASRSTSRRGSRAYAPRDEARELPAALVPPRARLPRRARPAGVALLPAVVAFYPASALVAAASLRRPALGLVALAGVGAAAGALGLERRRTPFEVATLAAVTPVYAVAHGAGMWRGLGLLLAERLRAPQGGLLEPALDGVGHLRPRHRRDPGSRRRLGPTESSTERVAESSSRGST